MVLVGFVNGVASRAAPQEPQKRAPCGASVEHEGHCDIAIDHCLGAFEPRLA